MAVQLTNKANSIEYYDTASGYREDFIKGSFRTFLRGEVVTLAFSTQAPGMGPKPYTELRYTTVSVPAGITSAKLLYDQIIAWDSDFPVVTGIDFPHNEIHEGNSYTAYFVNVTAATSGHRSGLYLKTPLAVSGLFHMIIAFSCSTAGYFSICEAPTIAANVGSHGNLIYNRYRDSIKESGCYDNATIPAVNKFTTLTETQIADDGTWDTGMVIRTEPLTIGAGPKPAGGASRSEQEWILKADTAYVFLMTNTTAEANTHQIFADWYELINNSTP